MKYPNILIIYVNKIQFYVEMSKNKFHITSIMSLPKDTINESVNCDIMKTPFVFFQSHPDDYKQITSCANKNVDEIARESVLSRVFFHDKNTQLIQKQIISQVFFDSDGDYLIEAQDYNDLQIIMQSVFATHAKHLHDNIREQIRDLNNLVVHAVVPSIITEIKSHQGYLKRAFGKREIMDRPQYMSNSGSKTLASQTCVWK